MKNYSGLKGIVGPLPLGVDMEFEFGDPGGVAQLGERLPCTQEVIGSIPFTSILRNLSVSKKVWIQSLDFFKMPLAGR